MDKSEEEKNQTKLPLEIADPNKRIPDLPDVVLRIIFRHLNGRDLSSATMVCRNWHDAANHEKCLRGPYCFRENIFIENTEELNFDCIKEPTIKPFIGIFFLVTYPIDFNYVKDGICKLLPINCRTILLFTFGSIMNDVINDEENDNSLMYLNMSYALLPQIPNIKLNIVLISKQNEEYTEYRQMIEEASRQDGSNGCLMIFCNENCRCCMVEIAMSKLSKRFSLYGGTVNMVKTNTEKKELYCVALLITGSIQTWSVIVQESLTPELVKKKLKIFKEQVELQKHSVGFVFSEYLKFRKSKIQNKLKIFKKVFPKVSLVGCFTVGVTYGRDTITYKEELMKDNGEGRIVFMILTYGNYVE